MIVAARSRVSSGSIEALKWVALACMVVDHINAAFYGRGLGLWADVLGRIAMPLFAGVFGYNLARPGADVAGALRRLLQFGAVAIPAHAWFFGWVGIWPLNILLTFAVAAWVILELQRGNELLAAGIFVIGGALVEYWWPGVALVLSMWALARSPRPQALDVGAVALSLLALCVLVNRNAYALLSVPVAAVVLHLEPAMPRLRWLFWWFYPVHLVLLVALTLALGV